MATFKFGRDINIHWNGYDIKGPADTVFSIPDQLYEEFEGDLRGAEPTLTWIDTNEFQTLSNAVSVTELGGSYPIESTATSSGKIISIVSTSASSGYVLTANGAGGVTWSTLPADATGITNVIGTSPISAAVSGSSATISLTANYQTSGNYVSSVSATSPITASISTAGLLSVGISASSISAASAAATRTEIRNDSGATLLRGQVVYLYGSSGLVPTVRLALADDDLTSANTFGIVESNISNNTNGYVTNVGRLDGLDTSGFADGVALWLSPTIAGAVQTTKPTGPSHGVLVGFVIKGGSVGAGEIYVYIKNGVEIDEVHDVNISGISNGHALIWSSSASVWQNSLIGSASISTGSITSGHISAGAVGSSAIATGSINSTHLGASSVISSKIATAAVTSGHIAAGAVGSAALTTGAVTSSSIAASAITSGHISAGAVGTAAISSGSATSGQVLTANGSSGVSFATLLTNGFTGNQTVTQTVINGSLLSTEYASATIANSAHYPAIAVDKANNIAWIVQGLDSIRKVNMATNSVMATISLSLNSVDSIERITDIAFGASKLIAVTGSSTALGRARYFVVDASAMTVQNSGNIKASLGTTNLTAFSRPTAQYDGQLGQFTVLISHTTTSTGSGSAAAVNSTFRVVHPTTYATRYHLRQVADYTAGADFALTAASTVCHPVWLAGVSRWAFGVGNGYVEFWSDSGASSAFLTKTGENRGLQNLGAVTDIKINSSTNSTFMYFTQVNTITDESYENIKQFYTSAVTANINGNVTSTTASSANVSAGIGGGSLGYGYGTQGDCDITEYNGETYIAFGGDVLLSTVNINSYTSDYGTNALSLASTGSNTTTRGQSLSASSVNRFNNSTKIYHDGTNLVVLYGRSSGTNHIKKAIVGTPTGTFYPFGISNTRPYLHFRKTDPYVLTNVSQITELTFVGTQDAIYTNGTNTGIFHVGTSSGMAYYASPNFIGTNGTISFTGATVS